MSYDTWKLRSDMDEADHSRTRSGGLPPTPRDHSCPPPCVSCAKAGIVQVSSLCEEHPHSQCSACERWTEDRDLVIGRCEICYHASVERTPGDDDAELDGISEGAE